MTVPDIGLISIRRLSGEPLCVFFILFYFLLCSRRARLLQRPPSNENISGDWNKRLGAQQTTVDEFTRLKRGKRERREGMIKKPFCFCYMKSKNRTWPREAKVLTPNQIPLGLNWQARLGVRLLYHILRMMWVCECASGWPGWRQRPCFTLCNYLKPTTSRFPSKRRPFLSVELLHEESLPMTTHGCKAKWGPKEAGMAQPSLGITPCSNLLQEIKLCFNRGSAETQDMASQWGVMAEGGWTAFESCWSQAWPNQRMLSSVQRPWDIFLLAVFPFSLTRFSLPVSIVASIFLSNIVLPIFGVVQGNHSPFTQLLAQS